jgi:archaetidylinositol phosphate synthase
MIRSILKTIRIPYNFIGLIAAYATAATVPHWWSEPFLVLSLLLVRIHGGLVTYQSPISQLGVTISSMTNRITEVFWAIAFYRLGAPLTWVFAFASLAAFQEYAKARIASIGTQNIVLDTLANPHTRASFLFIAILIYQFTASHTWIAALAASLTLLEALSFILLLRSAYKKLH